MLVCCKFVCLNIAYLQNSIFVTWMPARCMFVCYIFSTIMHGTSTTFADCKCVCCKLHAAQNCTFACRSCTCMSASHNRVHVPSLDISAYVPELVFPHSTILHFMFYIYLGFCNILKALYPTTLVLTPTYSISNLATTNHRAS